jgi:redox-sensing transcriptional repressor
MQASIFAIIIILLHLVLHIDETVHIFVVIKFTSHMIRHIPEPAVRRLIQMAGLLQKELANGRETMSSSSIGKELGVEANTIRKDINYLGSVGDASGGYIITRLLEKIQVELMLATKIKACIIGLGRLGEAFINYGHFEDNNIAIAAGFDVNINKLETLKTNVPLFPEYEMEDVVPAMGIEVAILAVPLDEVCRTLDKLSKCGIKGVLNYTGAVLPQRTSDGIYIRNLDINCELNMLKVLLKRNQKKIS